MNPEFKFKQDPHQQSLNVLIREPDREIFLAHITEIAQGKPFIIGEQPLSGDILKITVITASFTPTQIYEMKLLGDKYRGNQFQRSIAEVNQIQFPEVC